MSIDETDSTTTLPRGGYSTTSAQYMPKREPDTSAAPWTPIDTVRVVAIADRVIVSYDAGEYATRRMIRKLNAR